MKEEFEEDFLLISEKLTPEFALMNGVPMRESFYCPRCKREEEFMLHSDSLRIVGSPVRYFCSVCNYSLEK